jgi:hypothetical protein
VKRCLSLILLVLLSASAFAREDSVVTSFRSAALKIPRKLEQKYSHLGRIKISTLIGKIETLSMTSVDKVKFPSAGGNVRSSAYWVREKTGPKMFISRDFWPLTPKSVAPFIALHEVLGALGYADTDYNISAAMWLLSAREADVLNDDEKETIVEYVASRSGAGGIIGVGGGGDMGGPWLKISTLKVQLQDIAKMNSATERRQKLEVMLYVIDMGVEFQWNR